MRPVAEGIAGGAPPSLDKDSGNNRSYLMALCEGGLQYVKITGILKKNVELMFVDDNSNFRYLDNVVTPPAPSETMVRWSVRYLADKDDVA